VKAFLCWSCFLYGRSWHGSRFHKCSSLTFTNLEKFNNILQQTLCSLLFRCVNLN
jgi:hypothetical protein